MIMLLYAASNVSRLCCSKQCFKIVLRVPGYIPGNLLKASPKTNVCLRFAALTLYRSRTGPLVVDPVVARHLTTALSGST